MTTPTGWHRHLDGYVCNPSDACPYAAPSGPTTPVLVVDLVSAREDIARALWDADHPGLAWMYDLDLRDAHRATYYRRADAVLAVLSERKATPDV